MKYLSQFLESLSAERGYALNTLEAYARDIQDFNAFLKDKLLEEIKKSDIQQYLLHLKERAITSSSRARKLSALRQFFNFLIEEEVITDNPTLLIDLPKQKRPLPKTLTEKEVFALIEATDILDSRERSRLSCLLEILYATGMRVSELVSLQLKSVQKLLGHAGISTTQIYTHVMETQKQKLVFDHHPLSDATKISRKA